MMHQQPWLTECQQLSRFIDARVSNAQDAEDLLQEVLLKAYSKQATLSDERKRWAWLYQIARNQLTDYYRSRRQPEGDIDAFREILPADDLLLDDDDVETAVIDCLKAFIPELPEKYKTALIAADLDQTPQKLLAQQLDISYSGLKSRVQRGRNQLRQWLEIYCHVELDRYNQLLECQSRHPKPCC